MEEDIKSNGKNPPAHMIKEECGFESYDILKITDLDTTWLSAKFEKDYPGLTHKLIKNYNDRIYTRKN